MARNKDNPEQVIAEVLADTGSMVSVEEVRGFMRQALSRGDGLDEAIERCFGGPGPTNASGSEQERFRAAVERLWNREAQTFDPDADAAIVAVRDLVLALIRRIAEWVRSLDTRGIEPNQLPAEPTTRLGEMSGMLNGIMEVLNRGDESDPEELRRLRETISRLQPIIDSAIEDAEAELAGGEQSEPPGRQRGDHE